MIGLSTSGSISFGCALVAGRNRVPNPAAGKTALRTLWFCRRSLPFRRSLSGVMAGIIVTAGVFSWGWEAPEVKSCRCVLQLGGRYPCSEELHGGGEGPL